MPFSLRLISFPDSEIPSLIGRDRIVTHRVSDEFGKFHVGDFVRTSWGAVYQCIERTELNGVQESPFIGWLSESQIAELSRYGGIAVLVLKLVDSGKYQMLNANGCRDA